MLNPNDEPEGTYPKYPEASPAASPMACSSNPFLFSCEPPELPWTETSSLPSSCPARRDSKFGNLIDGFVFHSGLGSNLFAAIAFMNMHYKLVDSNNGQDSPTIMSSRDLDDSHLRKLESFGDSFYLETSHLIRVVLIDKARKVFDEMSERDVVSWNPSIARCSENGMYKDAVEMVREMGVAGLKPDSFTLSSVLLISAEFLDAFKGMDHGSAIRQMFD